MSEHLFRFLLSELTTVRIVCAKCGGVIETSIDKLSKVKRCPTCPADFRDYTNHMRDDDRPSLFADLAETLKKAQSHKGLAEVEFVLPDPTNQ
jgi:hypothetical protein